MSLLAHFPRRAPWAAALAAFLLPAVALADLASDEAILEGRLMAPCCNVQTLDVHASPLADELRAEIHRRLLAGDEPAAIEADLVARYGDTIRAAPKGRDSRTDFAVVLSAAAVGAAVAAVLYFRRRGASVPVRHDDAASQASLATLASRDGAVDPRWDARLDEELENFED